MSRSILPAPKRHMPFGGAVLPATWRTGYRRGMGWHQQLSRWRD
jgi:hypothetical protein